MTHTCVNPKKENIYAFLWKRDVVHVSFIHIWQWIGL